MTKPITITATSIAWTHSSYSTNDLLDALKKKDDAQAIDALAFSNADMGIGSCPWARVGTATITVEITSTDEVIAAQVKALQSELDAERAAWLTKQSAILERISKLTALTFDGGAVLPEGEE